MGRLRRLARGVVRGAAGARWDLVTGLACMLLFVAALLVVIVYIPQLAIDSHGLSRTDWLKAVQDLRTSILQGLGGLAVLAGAVIAALNLRETGRQNRAVLELQRRGQTTERFTKAIEQLGQLGPEKLDVRIGAVYALEQIARDSAELHWPIMEVLTAYLREHAHTRLAQDGDAWRLPADHQAIATVIGRRRHERDPASQRLDLRGVVLAGVEWWGAHLRWANLSGADLEWANLNGARLEEAWLHHAHLLQATFREAHLEAASLFGAHLRAAKLTEAHLQRTSFFDAKLEDANLRRASLEGADLKRADLTRANLLDARGLTLDQVQAAVNASQAYLPDDLARRLKQTTLETTDHPSGPPLESSADQPS